MDERLQRRTVFGQDAARYDRARPGYPAELFDALAAHAGLVPGSRLLEIGCGTGQATRSMARRGWTVDALELSPALAGLARRRLAGYPNVEVTTGSFDDADLPVSTYDAVAAFTSFHWLDPATRVARAAATLRPAGVLATVGTVHVRGADDFFDRAQRCYRRWDPGSPEEYVLPAPHEVQRDAAEIDASGRFGPVAFHHFAVDIRYTAEQFVDLLRTYSPILALAPGAREGLLSCLAELAGADRITKSYVFQLRMAAKLAD